VEAKKRGHTWKAGQKAASKKKLLFGGGGPVQGGLRLEGNFESGRGKKEKRGGQ